MSSKKRIAIISTGGTIEKTYDELSGVLANQVSVLDVMLASLELRGVEVLRVQLMNKDSLEMTAEDHALIAETSESMARATDGVIVVHGGVHRRDAPLRAALHRRASEPHRGAARGAAGAARRLRRDAQPGAGVPRRGQGPARWDVSSR
jgi:hypothetical protein